MNEKLKNLRSEAEIHREIWLRRIEQAKGRPARKEALAEYERWEDMVGLRLATDDEIEKARKENE